MGVRNFVGVRNFGSFVVGVRNFVGTSWVSGTSRNFVGVRNFVGMGVRNFVGVRSFCVGVRSFHPKLPVVRP
jgi:hypothetical protein